MSSALTEQQHTPGPWVGFSIDGKLLAIMPAGRAGDICSFAQSPSEADGNLLIAAPDMLAALRDVESKIVDFEAGRINWRPDDFLFRVRAAIAKARESVS